MKSILISIRPEWVSKTIKGEKKIEVRSSAPKDWMDYLSGKTKIEPKPRTAFIYCTKGSERFISTDAGDYRINGKVVGKFTLRKVEEIICRPICGEWESYTETLGYSEISQASCLENREIVRYLKGKNGYAWHISDLKIFDEPKGLNAFLKPNWNKGLDKELERARKEDAKIIKRIENGIAFDDEIANCEELTLLGFELSGLIEKAPKSWRYVEVEE